MQIISFMKELPNKGKRLRPYNIVLLVSFSDIFSRLYFLPSFRPFFMSGMIPQLKLMILLLG